MRRILPIEWISAVYCFLTLIIMLMMWSYLVEPTSMIICRAAWLIATGVMIGLYHHYPTRPMLFLRIALQMGWLQQWYPDIYEFNRMCPNMDYIFAGWDQQLFGCQPSLVFSEVVQSRFWSEAFKLGYVSYYPMILALVVVAYRHSDDLLKSCSFVVLMSFFVYYCIYLCLPVAGPQFYFAALSPADLQHGIFPELGYYFSSHTEMLPNPGQDGVFHRLLEIAQVSGERPQAAFPSSHIGISTIVMLLCLRHRLRLGLWLFPLWALLCCATVYIQAHYLVDAIAGLLSAPLVFALSSYTYRVAMQMSEEE